MQPSRASLTSLWTLTTCLALAAFVGRASGQALEQSEHGSFIINTLEAPGSNVAYKGVVIKLGKDDDAAVCFDTELLRYSAGWVKGQVDGKPGTGWAGLIDPRNSTSFTASHGGPPTIGVTGAKKPEKGKPAPKQEDQLRFSTKFGPGVGGGAKGDDLADPRPASPFAANLHLGPLPKDWAHYKGLYRNGDQVVLAYTVGGCEVLETPSLAGTGAYPAFTRTLRVDKSDKPMTLVVCDVQNPSGPSGVEKNVATLENKSGNDVRSTRVTLAKAPEGAALAANKDGRMTLTLPPHTGAEVFAITVWSGPKADAEKAPQAAGDVTDPSTLTKGGPAKWGEPIVTQGKLDDSGKPDDAYVVDTITAPEQNPWHAMTRFAGFDFFADGHSAAVSTIGGDVWVVRGIDDKLEHLQWKRFATGLFQPLGLKVVEDKVYVVGRDGITRLTDLNGDGEADFYENFNNDTQVTTNYHEFCLDLQTDSEGNFYYAKGSPWPPDVKSEHQGCMLKVSKDGSKLEVIATGLRAPNGSAMGPGDVLVCSDNEGHWMPASKVNHVKQGKFYGMVPAAHLPKGSPQPTTFEQPILWLPHGNNIDNSSGGEAFAPSKDLGGKWGPLDGHMIHMSYGTSSLFAVMTEEVEGVEQAAALKFPLKFLSSCMRARFNGGRGYPNGDGQLYLCGLKGWQTNAGRDGALQRIRYTGKPARMPVGFHAHKNGLAVTFDVPLDKASAADAGNWGVEQWNYQWTQNYGSKEYSVKDPTKTKHDDLAIKSVQLSPDGKTAFLEIADLQPVMQMKVSCKVKAADGKPAEWDIYNTIHKLGPEWKPGTGGVAGGR